MILDNQTTGKKLYEFLKDNTRTGNVDIVTGFFTIAALSFLDTELNDDNKFRLVLGKIVKDDNSLRNGFDFIHDNLGIDSIFTLSNDAKKAVDFLRRENVLVKNISEKFCHAKSYIFSDKDDPFHFSYSIVGSSNLTSAGIGLSKVPNLELNIAKIGNESEFPELERWMSKVWEQSSESITFEDKKEMNFKEYCIDQIKQCFAKYEPKDIYYKILYEFFSDEIDLSFEKDAESKKRAKLEDSEIFKKLFEYQKKGALSLISMLNKYNGAILGDAVGLGKTFTALAVIKYFQLKDYTVVVFCPKRLEENWTQYKEGENSCFESDGFEYLVRFHTDLQNKRLESNNIYRDFPLKKIQKKNKLLYVIDESHNFKSSSSGRYKHFVQDLLMPNEQQKDIKVLMLSATPINISLKDLANQIKLITRGDSKGFKEAMNILDIDKVFNLAEAKFKEWTKQENKDVNKLISSINEEVLDITDKLVVARKRNFVTKYDPSNEIKFPKKCPPESRYVPIENIGDIQNSESLYKAIEKIKFSAYIPTNYSSNGLNAHEKALAGIMINLVFKRLESSWHSCFSTLTKILEKHEQMLELVKSDKITFSYGDLFDFNDFDDADYEDEYQNYQESTNQINLTNINRNDYINDLTEDIDNLKYIIDNFDKYKKGIERKNCSDKKLDELADILNEKLRSTNRKTIVFTEYEDTAIYVYENLKKMGFKNIACVTGSGSSTSWGYEGKKFHDILKQFCPKAKLYNELPSAEKNEYSNYECWLKKAKNSKEYKQYLEQPIDILIATDCLSEGQNLQDADTIINYDIHWNPVRLIQRFGRIDRINSDNPEIKAINFWPTKDFDDYLRLKQRIEERVAMMLVTDTETEGIKKNADESIRNEDKLLKQLNINFDDIEEENFSLDDLSLEDFRQDLIEYLKANQKKFYKKPKGIFSSFDLSKATIQTEVQKGSLVAVLGYPRMPEGGKYKEKILVCVNVKGDMVALNNHQILDCLRKNIESERSPFIDNALKKNDSQLFEDFKKAIDKWLSYKNTKTNEESIDNLRTSNTLEGISTEEQIINKFKSENFDVLTWEYIS